MKYLLLLALLPIMIIPAFAVQGIISFDEFCIEKTADNRVNAGDFICELDIFQMKDDIEYLKSLTIPDYDKIPIVFDVNFSIDSDPPLTLDYMAQAFYNDSWVGMKLFEDGVSIVGITERQNIGLDKYDYSHYLQNWTNGTVIKLQILGNSAVIFEQEITVQAELFPVIAEESYELIVEMGMSIPGVGEVMDISGKNFNSNQQVGLKIIYDSNIVFSDTVFPDSAGEFYQSWLIPKDTPQGDYVVIIHNAFGLVIVETVITI